MDQIDSRSRADPALETCGHIVWDPSRDPRTPAQHVCHLLRVMRLWFPDRRVIFVGDSGHGTHEVARFARRHRLVLAMVGEHYPDAHQFEPPPSYGGDGEAGRPSHLSDHASMTGSEAGTPLVLTGDLEPKNPHRPRPLPGTWTHARGNRPESPSG